MKSLSRIPDIAIQFIDQPELTKTEMDIVVANLSNPTVKKYLNFVASNQIKDAANIPLDIIVVNPVQYGLTQAYVKGGLGMLKTLLSIKQVEEAKRKPDAKKT